MAMSERCRKCFAIVERGSETCPRCGEPYVSATESDSPRCPACGHENSAAATFCAACGVRMQAEEPQPAPVSSATEDPWGPESAAPSQPPCPRCGTARQFGASQCFQCGLPFGHTGFTTGVPAAVGVQGKPAGFWVRFGALVIDWIIQGVVLFLPLMIWLFSSIDFSEENPETPGVPGLLNFLFYLGPPVYSIFFHARFGATPGKMVLNIYVLNERGERRIGFLRALLRYIGTIVSGFTLYIGYIMVGFREDKRGLHDLIGSTYPTQIVKR